MKLPFAGGGCLRSQARMCHERFRAGKHERAPIGPMPEVWSTLPDGIRTVLRLAACALLCAGSIRANTYITHGVAAGSWNRIFSSVGMSEAQTDANASVIILGANVPADIQELSAGHLVIVVGFGSAAKSLGFTAKNEHVTVRSIVDEHAPKMRILWAEPVEIAVVAPPDDYLVFAAEKWKGAPVIAGKRNGSGGILWIAGPPGETGMERYPYLPQAALDLGLELSARTVNLWAFFDSAYRIRADVNYLAARWREAGIGVLHVAAWHNMEADPSQDAYLKRLIEACHRNAILVYAWLELPHVSEKFWAAHPQWREKTAVGQDAQLDWRKLMNLQNPDCRRAVEKEIEQLVDRFDWDGVNLAELYFESLEGAGNPARFTPMNEDIRAAFKETAGFDPKLLFEPASEYAMSKNPQALRQFLDFRAGLAADMQSNWLRMFDSQKARKPYLDVMLTHIDDRFEPGIRDALGADVARTLPVLEARHETLLVEDPAPLWSLGPDRYAKLALKYGELTQQRENLAVDINVVERYQDVYPTKKQTGIELLELVHQAAVSFRRVAIYFENSLEKQDLKLLAVAAATGKAQRTAVDEWQVEGSDAVRIPWSGPAELDGRLWPVQSAKSVLIPPGKHKLSPAFEAPSLTVTDFNGDVESVSASPSSIDLGYTSRSRAIANVSGTLSSVELDGAALPIPATVNGMVSLLLPAGQHLLSLATKQ